MGKKWLSVREQSCLNKELLNCLLPEIFLCALAAEWKYASTVITHRSVAQRFTYKITDKGYPLVKGDIDVIPARPTPEETYYCKRVAFFV